MGLPAPFCPWPNCRCIITWTVNSVRIEIRVLHSSYLTVPDKLHPPTNCACTYRVNHTFRLQQPYVANNQCDIGNMQSKDITMSHRKSHRLSIFASEQWQLWKCWMWRKRKHKTDAWPSQSHPNDCDSWTNTPILRSEGMKKWSHPHQGKRRTAWLPQHYAAQPRTTRIRFRNMIMAILY